MVEVGKDMLDKYERARSHISSCGSKQNTVQIEMIEWTDSDCTALWTYLDGMQNIVFTIRALGSGGRRRTYRVLTCGCRGIILRRDVARAPSCVGTTTPRAESMTGCTRLLQKFTQVLPLCEMLLCLMSGQLELQSNEKDILQLS